MTADPAYPAPAVPETTRTSKTIDRTVFGGATTLMVAVLSVAAGVSIKAQNLTRTRPGSDGDMFGVGPVSVVLVCVLIGLPVVIFAAKRFVSLVITSNPDPVKVVTVMAVAGWMATANAAMSWTSWAAVTSEMYRPASIERAQEAVFDAGAAGVLTTLAVGSVAALVLLVTRARATN